MTKEPKLPPEGDLAEELRRSLENLVEGELSVENLTANKLTFLRAWLKDDLHRTGDYLRGLGGELQTLEERTGDWLLNAADPTETAWPNLLRCISGGQPWALAGETVGEGEELQCLGCGYRVLPAPHTQITPCHRCGYGCFRQLEGGLEA
ncbi:zinc ribbon-containing protein [Microbulbifer sp. 2201CG32-9]|uniref:zinc ribbon-containing protein n=1 Tax=Microbulbifer sp. 2201CG32-9 TaxID=3232309 RepID=UPI00345C3DDF